MKGDGDVVYKSTKSGYSSPLQPSIAIVGITQELPHGGHRQILIPF